MIYGEGKFEFEFVKEVCCAAGKGGENDGVGKVVESGGGVATAGRKFCQVNRKTSKSQQTIINKTKENKLKSN
jgi:hypothetical protein